MRRKYDDKPIKYKTWYGEEVEFKPYKRRVKPMRKKQHRPLMTKEYMLSILAMLTILLAVVSDKMFNIGLMTAEGITGLVIFALLYFLIKDILRSFVGQMDYVN